MKVWFLRDKAAFVPHVGLELQPGVNEMDPAAGLKLLEVSAALTPEQIAAGVEPLCRPVTATEADDYEAAQRKAQDEAEAAAEAAETQRQAEAEAEKKTAAERAATLDELRQQDENAKASKASPKKKPAGRRVAEDRG